MIKEFLWPEWEDMDVIDEIEPQMCENVIENFIKRAWSCKRNRGGHMNDIIFYY